MASKLSGIELTRYDDLFKTDAEREADRQERIQIVPAAEVFPYSRQPYTIDRPTPDLVRLMDSIEHIGIAEPLIVRSRDAGGYDRGYDWGGLYEIYHRCSCWCCPLQRIDELRKLRHHHPELWKRLRDMDQRAIAQFGHNPLGQFKQNWTVERLEQRFAAEDAQISVFLSSGKDSTMTEKQKQECSEVETMLQGTPKQNVLISFDGKPPKTLEELEKEQKRQKKKHKDRGEAR